MLKGYKTYITGGIAIVTAVGMYLTGDDTLPQAIQLIITAIIGMTVRSAVANAPAVAK